MNVTNAVQRFLSTLLFITGVLLVAGVFIEGFLGSSEEPVVFGVLGAAFIAGGVMLRRRVRASQAADPGEEEQAP